MCEALLMLLLWGTAATRCNPDLADLQRFPPPAVVDDMITLNRSLRRNLEARLPCEQYREEELYEALAECDRSYDAWHWLACAQWERTADRFRQEYLHSLREVLGPEAYARGQMPPPFPLWALPRRD